MNVSGKLNTKETPLNSIEIGDNVQLNSSGLILNNEINVSASEILSNSELINISSNEINLDGYVWDSSGLIVNKVELNHIDIETFEYVGDVTMDNVICAEAEDSIGGLKTFTNIECNNSSAESCIIGTITIFNDKIQLSNIDIQNDGIYYNNLNIIVTPTKINNIEINNSINLSSIHSNDLTTDNLLYETTSMTSSSSPDTNNISHVITFDDEPSYLNGPEYKIILKCTFQIENVGFADSLVGGLPSSTMIEHMFFAIYTVNLGTLQSRETYLDGTGLNPSQPDTLDFYYESFHDTSESSDLPDGLVLLDLGQNDVNITLEDVIYKRDASSVTFEVNGNCNVDIKYCKTSYDFFSRDSIVDTLPSIDLVEEALIFLHHLNDGVYIDMSHRTNITILNLSLRFTGNNQQGFIVIDTNVMNITNIEIDDDTTIYTISSVSESGVTFDEKTKLLHLSYSESMIVDVVSSSVIYKGNQLNSTANTVIIDRQRTRT